MSIIILAFWGGHVPQLACGRKAQYNMGHAVNDMKNPLELHPLPCEAGPVMWANTAFSGL